jgi:nitrate/TMAO reductase-like tetraheme cytochrome c subunit
MSEEGGPAPAGAGHKTRGEEQAEARPQSLIHNWISRAGIFLLVVIIINGLLFLLALGSSPNPYVGILLYLAFPTIALVGLLLIPLGMVAERRRRRKMAPEEIPRHLRIDLNVPATRHALLGAAGLALVFVVGGATASYHAYQFTDTVTFCGLTCHTVMKPEFTAYQHSPHARVPCVSCHVGPGAGWFVRSKITGSYQVYAVVTHVYPRPIATPIKFLRPVRAACEQCHWPEKFYGEQLRTFVHYSSDEKNTPTQISMLVKTGGGGGGEYGRPEGIHWHMAIANQVWFIATDKQEQDIPWVEVRSKDRRVVDYLASGSSLTPQQIQAAPKQLVDCVTCHSRPSHEFRPPDEAVNQALAAGQIDASLPYLKAEAVKLLSESYPSTEKAEESIASGLDRFYYEKYPKVYEERRTDVTRAIAGVQEVYRDNIFPYMKADWRTHPNNLGHLYYPGCFRCHDGQHVATDGSGRTIPSSCDTCHTLLSQGPPKKAAVTGAGVTFAHPIDLSGLPSPACFSCHTGGAM